MHSGKRWTGPVNRQRGRRAASAPTRKCASLHGKRSAQRTKREGLSTHGALRLAGLWDTPSGQGLVLAWGPWLCPLWARSGLQGCSIPCGAIRKWWPGEWPQASPVGTKPNRRAQKGIPVFANAKMRQIEMPNNRHPRTEFHSITDDTE
jgi:hypothetical protein